MQFFLVGFLLADLYVVGLRDRMGTSTLWDLVSLVGWPLLVVKFVPKQEFFALLPFLTLLLYIAALRGKLSRRIFSNLWLTTIGGMCYSIYLTHWFVLKLAFRLTKYIIFTHDFTINMFFQVFCLSPAVLFVTGLFFLAIERPCMRRDWPARLWSALFPAQAQAPAVTTERAGWDARLQERLSEKSFAQDASEHSIA